MMRDMGAYPLRFGQTLASNEWIEFHIHKFLTSRFKAYCLRDGEVGRARMGTALILWAECYRQDPAGSLPDDDVELAQLAGYGADVAAWAAVRGAVLHGWMTCLCEDEAEGQHRLGHSLIAEIAARSYRRKSGKVAGREAAAISVDRSRAKRQLEKLGARLLAAAPEVVDQIVRWCRDSGLWITEDNVRQGAEVITGQPLLRVVTTGKVGTFQ